MLKYVEIVKVAKIAVVRKLTTLAYVGTTVFLKIVGFNRREPVDVANDRKVDCLFGSGFCRLHDGGLPVDIMITVTLMNELQQLLLGVRFTFANMDTSK